MYRANLNNRDKGSAIAAVIAIHALLLFALLHLSGKIDLSDPQSVMRTFDLRDVPPPPPPPQQAQRPKPKAEEGGSAPKNIKSQATPVVAPKPKMVDAPGARDRLRAKRRGMDAASDTRRF